MIIKGSSRSGPRQLGRHLQRTDTNGRVEILELQSPNGNITEALRDWQLIAEGTRGTKGLYHANIDPDARYKMTGEQWQRAVEVLEEELGLTGQPRIVVMHEKNGRTHIHVVWQRTDVDTMTLKTDGNNYYAHERASQALEKEFGHEHVPGKHAKRDREKPPPKAEYNHAEWQQYERDGIDPKARKAAITDIFQRCDNGQAFRAALSDLGFILAKGDRRDFVLVDQLGQVHSLGRQVNGVRAKELREFMADVDKDSVPTIDEAKTLQRERNQVATQEASPEVEPVLPEPEPEERQPTEQLIEAEPAPEPEPLPPPQQEPEEQQLTEQPVEAEHEPEPEPSPPPQPEPEALQPNEQQVEAEPAPELSPPPELEPEEQQPTEPQVEAEPEPSPPPESEEQQPTEPQVEAEHEPEPSPSPQPEPEKQQPTEQQVQAEPEPEPSPPPQPEPEALQPSEQQVEAEPAPELSPPPEPEPEKQQPTEPQVEAEPAPEPELADEELARLEAALKARHEEEARQMRERQEIEHSRTGEILEREIAEKLEAFDAMQHAARQRNWREHFPELQGLDAMAEKLKSHLNPDETVRESWRKGMAHDKFSKELQAERARWIDQQLASKQHDMGDLSERHAQERREHAGKYTEELARYKSEYEDARRLAAEIEARHHQEEREEDLHRNRDGPGPPGRTQ